MVISTFGVSVQPQQLQGVRRDHQRAGDNVLSPGNGEPHALHVLRIAGGVVHLYPVWCKPFRISVSKPVRGLQLIDHQYALRVHGDP